MSTERMGRTAKVALAFGLFFLAGCKAGLVESRAAFDFHCAKDQIQIQELGGWAFHAKGCGQEADYVCSESGGFSGGNDSLLVSLIASSASSTCSREPSRAAAPSAPSPSFATVPFPDSVVGFSLGQGAAQAASVCTAASGTWSGQGDSFACNLAPQPIGSPASVALHFCGEAPCRVDVWTSPIEGETWLDRFAALRSTLGARYGAPTSEGSDLPPECQKDVIGCLEKGKARFWTSWQWPTRHAIRLGLGKIEGGVVLGIRYESPAGSAAPPL